MIDHNLLSQVFLTDNYYRKRVISALDCKQKNVLEIGAGDGRISKMISAKAKFLYCIEIDLKLSAIIKKELADNKNTKVICDDFRNISLTSLDKELVIFSNVPYHLSRELIKYLINYRKDIITSYLILQKEFVDKIRAKPGNKSYGVLSCLTQYNGKVKHLFNIPAGAFRPSPKVNSSFIEIEFYQKKPIQAKNEFFLFQFIKEVFKQRRKKIKTVVKEQFSPQALCSLVRLGIDLNQRPEQISLDDFCKISDCLHGLQ